MVQAQLSLEVEFRRDGNGKVKVEVGALGAKGGLETGGGLGDTRRQVLTLTLQVRDEARGGERARIRRTDGGLDATADDAVASAPGAEGAQMRPWEA
ncbi:hypothetical protein ACF1BS_21565 [Streptomyces sp. NPDC014748]|uniref:hypothetical protein n=1 Tax=Streptomyces sp. NPDC014748 TaxID=3364905 RepID=UPI0036F56D6F